MCGFALTTSSRFCSSCGALVKPESPKNVVRAAVRVDKDPVDPMASTAPASLSPLRKSRASEPSPEASVSPKAETGFQIPKREIPAAPKAGAGRGQTAPLSSLGAAAQRPIGSPRAGAPIVGARVLVQWANGQKYPGVLEQLVGLQCLVRFETGERRWVESRYVLPA